MMNASYCNYFGHAWSRGKNGYSRPLPWVNPHKSIFCCSHTVMALISPVSYRALNSTVHGLSDFPPSGTGLCQCAGSASAKLGNCDVGGCFNTCCPSTGTGGRTGKKVAKVTPCEVPLHWFPGADMLLNCRIAVAAFLGEGMRLCFFLKLWSRVRARLGQCRRRRLPEGQ